MGRPPKVHEFQPQHSTGKLLGRLSAELGPDRYKQVQQILIGGVIILIVALMMINGYYKAKKPALIADCTGRLRILGQALEMYSSDHDFRMPKARNWRYALSPYCDVVGGVDAEVETVRRTTKARGFSSPMRCLGNQSRTPISYFYLDRLELLGNAQAAMTDSAPVLVDEVHHPKAVMLRDDGGVETMERVDWVNMRQDELRIARRRDWRVTFAYEALPPPPPPEPTEAEPSTP